MLTSKGNFTSNTLEIIDVERLPIKPKDVT